MRNILNRVFALLVIVLVSACKNDKACYLLKHNVKQEQKIDTIESLQSRNLYLLNIVTPGVLGDFENQLAIAMKINKDSSLVYSIQQSNNEGPRISDKYIAYVKLPGYQNWGWFYMKDGKLLDKLPGIDKIIDSLEYRKRGKFSISQKNGYISYVNNGEKGFLDYGNIITQYKTKNFKNLDFKLYQFIDGELKVISNNGDDLFKQKEGLYFLPPPGYGVNRFFSKKKLFETVESVSKLPLAPEQIKIEPVKY